MLLTVRLLRSLLHQVVILIELREQVLRDLCVLFGWRAPEDVEPNFEPLIDFSVNLVVLGA